MEKKPTLWQKCVRIFTGYIGCNLLDAVIIGALTAAFLWAMDMPHIAIVSIAAGVCNMIPTVGPVLGAVIGAALVWPGKPVNILWFLLFTVLLQLLDSYLIKPKLFGNTLGLPSLAVILVTLAGGYFFGPLGLLVAVPAVAAALLIWREKLRPKDNELSGDTDPDENDR